ncbi:NADH-ubiquinone oxidoreductase-F iron-sulfur binding region domain-containing protein [Proteinivorax tanatarense]|uniref:NADH-ubiquinone oxidoreductase-F iron-sulfur binding region domain-containing protein n=1 Tax=Proteinivorax tanatarense TaxID=1260629 RepID=A0AAU7VKP4_9FIRM
MERVLSLNEQDLEKYDVEKLAFDSMAVVESKGEEVIKEIKEAELLSRDGRKIFIGNYMEEVAKYTGSKEVVLHIGNSKLDNGLASSNTYHLVQGLVLSAKAVKASKVSIFINESHQLISRMLKLTIKQMGKMGYFKAKELKIDIIDVDEKNIFFNNDIALLTNYKENLSHGRYPFLEAKNTWQQSKLFIANVETLINISLIVENGSSWFKTMGEADNYGCKVFYVNNGQEGCLVTMELGSNFEELIKKASERINIPNLYAINVGGSLGGVLTEEQLKTTKIDYATSKKEGFLLGASPVEVIEDKKRLTELIVNSVQHNSQQSCGKCSTCREGLKRMGDLVPAVFEGERDKVKLVELFAKAIKDSSLCGFGNKAINPIMASLQHKE